MLDWFKKLRDTGNLRQGVVLNVASVQKGECPISMVYDFDGFAKRDSTGLPLEVIIPKDGTVGMIFAQYISKVAPHPNAARLFLDFLLSDEGQTVFRDASYIPAHPSIASKLPPLKPGGEKFKLLLISPEMSAEHLPNWTKIYTELFQ